MSEEIATEGELQHTLSVHQRELTSITDKIREVRQQARNESISAAACRQSVDSAKIKHWQDSIARLQTEALAAQSKIGETNRAIRALRSSTNNQHSQDKHQEKRRQDRELLYLACFHQIAQDSLDPRQFEALEDGARALVRDDQQMHQEEAKHA